MKNQAKITGFRKTKNGSYQMEVTQTIDLRTTINSGNLLSEMNIGDSRFEQNGPKGRKTWPKVTPEYAKAAFDIDITALHYDESGNAKVSLDNPCHTNGMPLNIRVVESTDKEYLMKNAGLSQESADLMFSNPEKFAKQTPGSEEREAQYFIKEGLFVYSVTTIVAGEVTHDLVSKEDTQLVPKSEAFGVASKIADTIKVA